MAPVCSVWAEALDVERRNAAINTKREKQLTKFSPEESVGILPILLLPGSYSRIEIASINLARAIFER
jgi:hypothetical protein